jgi:hypothetical protein
VAGGRFHEADDLEVLETDERDTLDRRFAVKPRQKGVSGWERDRSLSRNVATTVTAMGTDEWARCPKSCRLAASAQWRSSSTTRSGISIEAAVKKRTTDSMTMKRSASDSDAGDGACSPRRPVSSGTRRAKVRPYFFVKRRSTS